MIKAAIDLMFPQVLPQKAERLFARKEVREGVSRIIAGRATDTNAELDGVQYRIYVRRGEPTSLKVR